MAKYPLHKFSARKQQAVITRKDLDKLPSQIAEIFIGDEQLIHRAFWGILKKNRFPSIKSLPAKYIQMIADDISQIVWARIWELYQKQSLENIKNKRAYVRQIVRFKIIDTNKWLSRHVSYEDLLQRK